VVFQLPVVLLQTSLFPLQPVVCRLELVVVVLKLPMLRLKLFVLLLQLDKLFQALLAERKAPGGFASQKSTHLIANGRHGRISDFVTFGFIAQGIPLLSGAKHQERCRSTATQEQNHDGKSRIDGQEHERHDRQHSDAYNSSFRPIHYSSEEKFEGGGGGLSRSGKYSSSSLVLSP
jgi:hypothetical protein